MIDYSLEMFQIIMKFRYCFKIERVTLDKIGSINNNNTLMFVKIATP